MPQPLRSPDLTWLSFVVYGSCAIPLQRNSCSTEENLLARNVESIDKISDVLGGLTILFILILTLHSTKQ